MWDSKKRKGKNKFNGAKKAKVCSSIMIPLMDKSKSKLIQHDFGGSFCYDSKLDNIYNLSKENIGRKKEKKVSSC